MTFLLFHYYCIIQLCLELIPTSQFTHIQRIADIANKYILPILSDKLILEKYEQLSGEDNTENIEVRHNNERFESADTIEV